MCLHAQVTLDILEPSTVAGSLTHTWAAPAADSWNTPDMALPANRRSGTLALALDGSASDSLVCSAILDPTSLSGKIALLYRGTCDYSEKALFCQSAGAIAVIIVNNIPGPPVGMGAGAVGQQVTIPVFQIGQADGAILRAELDAGSTIGVLLGNKNGYFNEDLGLDKFGVLLPPAFARPAALAANPGEHIVRIAAWAHNYGQLSRSGAVLRATVEKNGNLLYDHTSPAFDIAAGDSAFITLPDFTSNSFSGRYVLTYRVAYPGNDQHPADNSFVIPMDLESLYTLAPVNATTGKPTTTIGIRPATPGGEYESCIHFRDAHASRMAVAGIHTYVAKNAPGVVTDELITVRAYEWVDQFTGLSDGNFGINTLVEIGATDHFLTGTGNEDTPYLAFEAPVMLLDGSRYLFCASTFNPDIFLGYNRDVHYATHEQVYDQPTSPNRTGNSWFVGFVGGPVSSLGVHMMNAANIGMPEREHSTLAAYPNPGTGVFQLMLKGTGSKTITVHDASGRTILMSSTATDLFTLDLRDEAPGVYTIQVVDDQSRSVGRVVVQ